MTPGSLQPITSATDPRLPDVLDAMAKYGGGFVARLAEAWRRADGANSARLIAAFPDLLAHYLAMAVAEATR